MRVRLSMIVSCISLKAHSDVCFWDASSLDLRRQLKSSTTLFRRDTVMYLRTGPYHCLSVWISISPSEWDLPVFLLVKYCRLFSGQSKSNVALNCNRCRRAIMRPTFHAGFQNKILDMIVIAPVYLVQTNKNRYNVKQNLFRKSRYGVSEFAYTL